MRVLVQRVRRSSVTVEGNIVGKIGRGLLVLLGISHTDSAKEAEWMCEKLLRLRIFEDEEGKMNRAVTDVGGGILVVSQFTLYGDVQRGTRPSFTSAAPPDTARALYEEMLTLLRSKSDLPVESGVFGAMMDVELVNDGPVTIWITRGE